MASIELRNVSVDGPKGEPVLRDVSLTVPARTTLAVLGAPGSGKSTLLRTIAGLQDHTEGDVRIGGKAVNVADPRRRNVAIALDEPRLHPQLDVFDNLSFAASLQPGHDRHTVAADAAAVADALALTDLITERPDHLSAAHQQRVALGRELIRNANAWLFDDPFDQQSERVRGNLRSVVARWQSERARTSVFATDSVAEALYLGDQLAVLHKGTLHQIGPPREVYEYPADVVVASLLGTPHMNLIPAKVEGTALQTPLGSLSTAPERVAHLAERDTAIVGLRPEHIVVLGPGEVLPGAAEFDAVVGEVEWRGADQLLLIGFEADSELEGAMAHLEDLFDLDLFQDYLVVQAAPEDEWEPGDAVRLAVQFSDVRVFDSESGFDVELIELAGDEDAVPDTEPDHEAGEEPVAVPAPEPEPEPKPKKKNKKESTKVAVAEPEPDSGQPVLVWTDGDGVDHEVHPGDAEYDELFGHLDGEDEPA